MQYACVSVCVCVCVCASAVEYAVSNDNLNLSAIRTVRVLRPIRAINRIPSQYISAFLYQCVSAQQRFSAGGSAESKGSVSAYMKK